MSRVASGSRRITCIPRRAVLQGCLAAVLVPTRPATAANRLQELTQIYTEAFTSRTFAEEDALWGRAIDLDPGNSASWSNRGTRRLQEGLWQQAASDLEEAARLETAKRGRADAVVLNNLGNAKGALGDWDGAVQCYEAAAKDQEIGSIALANMALARFQQGMDSDAIRIARQLLRRDAEFLDARCALAAFLWATGDNAGAESEWEALQQSQDGLGGEIYPRAKAVDRVRTRWPPRATAALSAFLNVTTSGEAMGYDGALQRYEFGSQKAA